MKKTVLAAGLIAVMSLTACGGKVTPESLLVKANTKSGKAKSADIGMLMDMEASIAASGMTMDMAVKVDMDMDMTVNPMMMHTTGSMSMDILGQNETADIEMYMEQDGDKAVVYTKVADDGWSKEETDDVFNMLSTFSIKDVATVAQSLELAEDTETINNIECYKLSGNIAGAEVQEMMGTMMDSMEGMDLVGDMDMSAVEIPLEYYIAKKDNVPVKMTMDMNDVMKQALDTSMKETVGTEEVTTEVSKCSMEINFNSYDSVDGIEIPAEVRGE